MKISVVFESHSTSTDNEISIASGRLDPPLSAIGKSQAEKLGYRYDQSVFSVVYCSDLKRSVQTAEIAFGTKKIKIVQDPRLREWDYGDFNGYPSRQVDPLKLSYIHQPFPNGESLMDAHNRVCEFLQTIHSFEILIVGHRSTYYSLEHLSSNASFEDLLRASWHWQAGWKYQITNQALK